MRSNTAVATALLLAMGALGSHFYLSAENNATLRGGRPRPLSVAVFGGSTTSSTGASNYGRGWVSVFAKEFRALTGRDVVVDNFARIATPADHFASCIERFVGNKAYDLVFLEFAINGGSVTRLVESIYNTMSTRVVLIRQMSCGGPSNGDRSSTASTSFPEFRQLQLEAAFNWKLVELDFVNHLTPMFGSPCSDSSRRALFFPDGGWNQDHHLGDLGHSLLGKFVAKEISERLPEVILSPLNLVNSSSNYCLYNDGHGHSGLSNAFAGNGWEFIPGEAPLGSCKSGLCGWLPWDNACFISRTKGSILRSKSPLMFKKLEILIELSADKARSSLLQVSCAGKIIGTYTTHEFVGSNWHMAVRHQLETECNGTLEFLNSSPPDCPDCHFAKVCAVVLYT